MTQWIPARPLAERHGFVWERQREKLLKQKDVPYRYGKAPGNNGRRFKMVLIPEDRAKDFIEKVCAYKRGPYKKQA